MLALVGLAAAAPLAAFPAVFAKPLHGPPEALPLALGAPPPKGYAAFQLAIANGERQVSLLHLDDSLVWHQHAPELGSRLAIALRPGNYVFEQRSTVRGAYPQQFALTIDR
ncbi:MAG: hypothetical protein ACYCWW_14320, partial [Deltaproteobacteria bacterium]